MKGKATAAIACIILLATSGRPGAAQVTVSPYGGLLIHDGSLAVYRDGVRQEGSGIDGDGNVPVFGIRMEYEMSNRWATELSYGRASLENSNGSFASHQLYGLLRYAFLRSGKWQGNAGAGAGIMTFRGTRADITDAVVAGGVGAAYQIRERAALRGDVRFLGQFCSQGEVRNGLSCNDGSQLGYSEFSLGLAIRL